jgi:histidinol dehydrogenase
MAEVRISDAAATALAPAGAAIARAEGFELHAESMEARVRENEAS